MRKFYIIGLIVALAACSGGSTSPSTIPAPDNSGSVEKYTVGGVVSGLTGTLILQDNSGDDLTLTSNDAFTFATSLADGSTYAVTIKTQPTGLSCALSNGSGTLKAQNVTNVTIVCRKAMIAYYSSRNLDGSNSANTNSTTNIWVVNFDGTESRAITKAVAVSGDGGGYQPQWSPKGNQLVFSSSLKLPDGGNADGSAHNLWVANADGSGLKPITTNTHVISGRPQWSPDGQKVVFASWQNIDGSDAGGAQNIWVINADGSGLKALTTITGANNPGLIISAEFPQWSPDGTKIIFFSNRKLDGSDAMNDNQAGNVWVMNGDGSGLKPLTSFTTVGVYNPQWSPDGSKIVFVSTNIWVMNSDGSGLKAITSNMYVSQPQWSPDGGKIVYQSWQKPDGSIASNGPVNVWIMNADGSNQNPVTFVTASNITCANPQWSSDGSMIVFQSNQKVDGSDASGGTGNIWVVGVDGSGLKALTTITVQGVTSGFPQWSF